MTPFQSHDTTARSILSCRASSGPPGFHLRRTACDDSNASRHERSSYRWRRSTPTHTAASAAETRHIMQAAAPLRLMLRDTWQTSNARRDASGYKPKGTKRSAQISAQKSEAARAPLPRGTMPRVSLCSEAARAPLPRTVARELLGEAAPSPLLPRNAAKIHIANSVPSGFMTGNEHSVSSHTKLPVATTGTIT